MQIAVASGKGGTGKTTISVALASYLSLKGKKTLLLDCDVEEPNSNLFLKAEIDETEDVNSLVPVVDMEKCNGCGKCDAICAFSAIVMIKDKPLVFPDMCHSCGGCMLACPREAITEKERPIGILEKGKSGDITYIGGRLNIGEAMSPPLIKAVKESDVESDVVIIDSPPGTSCPVIEAIDKSDYVILVTEPTPFGLNDLKLAVGMVRETGQKFGIIINRSDSGDSRVVDYCRDEGIDLIAEIPESRDIAVNYSKGDFIEPFIEKFSSELDAILEKTGIIVMETDH